MSYNDLDSYIFVTSVSIVTYTTGWNKTRAVQFSLTVLERFIIHGFLLKESPPFPNY
jgi:hypothetical protein